MNQANHPSLAPAPVWSHALERPLPFVRGISGETLISFVTFFLLLFLPQLGGMAPLLIIILYIGITFLNPTEAAQRMQGRWVLFAPGWFALLSTLWSVDPVTTLRLSIELVFTIYVGLWLAGSPRPGEIIAGLAMASALYLFSSLALGQTVAIGTVPGGEAFSGFNLGKNLFGDIAAIGILSMVGLHCGTWMKKPLLTLLLLLALGVEIRAVILSQSAGAMLAALGGCVVMLGLVLLGQVRPLLRVWLMIVAGLLLLLVVTAYLVAGDALIQALMAMFHKDPTMTGRLYLWSRSTDIIASRPWLGQGYSAFWVPGNLDAEGLLTWSRIPSRSGFNFHNAIIENLVEIGYVGLTVLAGTVLLAALGLLVRALRQGQVAAAFWFAILAYELSRIPIEALGPLPFYHTTVLVWVGMGMAWTRRERSANQASARELPRYA